MRHFGFALHMRSDGAWNVDVEVGEHPEELEHAGALRLTDEEWRDLWAAILVGKDHTVGVSFWEVP